MPVKRRQHDSAFKAKVALAATLGEKTLAESHWSLESIQCK